MSPTRHVPDRLLVTRADRMTEIMGAVRRAALELGWDVVPETLDGRPVEAAETERAAAADAAALRAPTVHRLRIIPAPGAPPADSGRLLRRLRRAGAADGLALDPLMSVDAGRREPAARTEQETP